jgi:tripartite-type tricarboxylate transporter receptor subunit TctC
MTNLLRARASRRGFLAAAAASAAPALFAQTGARPITVIAPFAPGASADGIARIVARELSALLGQPAVVENRPGAGGATGLIAVAKAAPDGSTIGLGATGAIAINPHLPDAPPLNPRTELVPLAKVADIPLVFVTSAGSGYANLQALLQASRASASGLSYAHSGQYTAQHLSGELLASMTGAKLVPVPYRGSGPAVTDVLGGTVPAAMVDLTSAYQHVKAGKLVALGVTGASRSKAAPEIPTLAEEGVAGYSAPAWMGLFLPARTPADVRSRLGDAMQKILANPAVQAQVAALAAEPAFLDGDGFARFIDTESRKWAQVIARLPAAPGK